MMMEEEEEEGRRGMEREEEDEGEEDERKKHSDGDSVTARTLQCSACWPPNSSPSWRWSPGHVHSSRNGCANAQRIRMPMAHIHRTLRRR